MEKCNIYKGYLKLGRKTDNTEDLTMITTDYSVNYCVLYCDSLSVFTCSSGGFKMCKKKKCSQHDQGLAVLF